MISIYNYTDYKKYLGDYYRTQKENHPHFSFQLFADRAGFKSKTYLHKIINGKKCLARVSILKVAKALKLKQNETSYFEVLVNFNDARSIKDREYYFNCLQELGQSDPARPVLKSQFQYFSRWYFVVIRELITIQDFKDDFKLLAKSVEPSILPEQAEHAVKTLIDLGLIRKSPSGKYVQTDNALTTDPDITPLAVQVFQKECLKLASDSIEYHNNKVRDISTLTVGISQRGFDKISGEIAVFRKKLVEIVKNDNPADRVYQINFQLFPLSKVQNKGIKK